MSINIFTKTPLTYEEIVEVSFFEELGWEAKASAAWNVMKFQKENPTKAIPWIEIAERAKINAEKLG